MWLICVVNELLCCLVFIANVSSCVIRYGATTKQHATSVCAHISNTNICSQDFETYHCNNRDNSPSYEVHVFGLYQAATCCNDVPETSRIDVVNQGQTRRSVVLVLASTRPVAWFLNLEDGTVINKVIMVSLGEIFDSSV